MALTSALSWRSSPTGGFMGLLPNRLPTSRSTHQQAVSSKDSSVHAIAIRSASSNSLSAPSIDPPPFATMRLPSEGADREPHHRPFGFGREHRRVRVGP